MPAIDRLPDRFAPAGSSPTAHTPGDPADSDALLDLGDEIATLAAHVHAATHRMLILLVEFDRRRGWEGGGHRSCAHWLAFRTGIALGAARERVRAARALVLLPAIGESMARGELSFAKVRALTRVATPENETSLLDFARAGTAAQVEEMVRGWRCLSRGDELALERIRHRKRTLSVVPDLDGTYVVRGRLEPEVGSLLMRAIEAASDALFVRREGSNGGTDKVTPAQRRADAIALLAERALGAGFGPEDGAPTSGSRPERYQVVLHVGEATLREPDALRPTTHLAPDRSHLEDGTRVSAETSRRLSCDGSLVRMRHGPDGTVLDVGRRTRTIPPAVRRALEDRDRGCRFPGCGLRFTDGHHIRHWADGGETRLDNLVLLCRFHHRLVHEEGYRVDFPEEGRPNFYRPNGIPVPDAPPAVTLGKDPVASLVVENNGRGVRPDWRTAGARWKRNSDVDEALLAGVVAALGGA